MLLQPDVAEGVSGGYGDVGHSGTEALRRRMQSSVTRGRALPADYLYSVNKQGRSLAAGSIYLFRPSRSSRALVLDPYFPVSDTVGLNSCGNN